MGEEGETRDESMEGWEMWTINGLSAGRPFAE